MAGLCGPQLGGTRHLETAMSIKKRARRLRVWHWSDPLYDVSVLLLKCKPEQATTELTRIFGTITGNGVGEFGNFTGAKTLWVERKQGVALVLWFPQWWTAKDGHHLGVLAHECFHAAEFVMRERGMVLTDASDEAYAYYLAWMFRECHKRLSK